MNQSPLVSLITPSLNQAHFLEEALRSVAEQDYPNLEQIVVDGGSQDGTVELLRTTGYGRRLVWVSEPDEGTSEAINKGMAMAQGEFVWILNADDRLADAHVISALVHYLLSHPEVDFVYGSMLLMTDAGQVFGQRCFPAYTLTTLLMDRRHLPWPGCLLRRATFMRLGGLNRQLRYANDLDFFLRLALNGTMHGLPMVTGIFRIHALASTQANVYAAGMESVQVCTEFLKQVPEEALAVRKQRIQAAIAFYAAGVGFHSGYPAQVRQQIWSAVVLQPRYLFSPRLWIYLVTSLCGNVLMRRMSLILRALLQVRFWQKLNQVLAKPI